MATHVNVLEVLDVLKRDKWAIVAGCVIVYLFYLIAWAKFFSPTARVPGDLIDKVSKIRMTLNGLRGRKMYFVEEQLKKYGPLVEMAPNSLATSDSAAIKCIYGSHDWHKSRFYSDFADFQSTPSLFSEVRPKRAQVLRKAFLPAFARANLVAMSVHIFAHLEKFVHKLDEFESKGEPLETYRWFRYLTFEVVTDVGFGGEYDMITHGEVDHAFVRDFDDSVTWGILKSFVGPFLNLVPRALWPVSLKTWAAAEDRTEAHAHQGLDNWRAQRAAGQIGHRVDILQRLIDHGEKYPDQKLSERELVTEIMEIMLAGGDTTASTVTYACYELARFPKVQEKLRAALKEAVPDTSEPIKLEDLEGCTYLDWTVKEMLRTHPTLPSTLERVVPPNGAVVAGYQLKSSTIVSMSAYIQHQQESIFPHPEIFEPERWAKENDEMRLNSLAFSTGPRSCVGQNLATMQMKIHMGVILRNFRVEAHPHTTPESMVAQDFFQGKPLSGKCLLYFKRVRD